MKTIFLVRTHSPGNLGSCARAAKAFGAALCLVDPRADAAHPDARAFASGADDVLDGASRISTLTEARDRCELLVALSAMRDRRVDRLPAPVDFAALRPVGSLGLVFGPERGGLETAELQLADRVASFATNPAFPTLNLGQSVAAALALLADPAPASPPPADEASPRELRLAVEALAETLSSAGYPAPGHSPDVVFELGRMIERARPSAHELKILRGALRALQRQS